MPALHPVCELAQHHGRGAPDAVPGVMDDRQLQPAATDLTPEQSTDGDGAMAVAPSDAEVEPRAAEPAEDAA